MKPTIEQLLNYFELSDDGHTLRVMIPRESDNSWQQRFSVNEKGIATGQHDYPQDAFGYHGIYIDGRFYFQIAPSIFESEDPNADENDPNFAPRAAAFNIQATSLSERILLNLWMGGRIADDGKDAILAFVSTGDAWSRLNSRNLLVKGNLINQGKVKAAEIKEIGETEVMPQIKNDYPDEEFIVKIVELYLDKWSDDEKVYMKISRCMFDIGNNTNNRPKNDYQFYIDKHLNEP